MHCDLLRLAFSGVADRFHVIAAASNVAEILRVVQADKPEVVIVSDHLEDEPLAGIGILPEIRKINPAARVLVLTATSDRALIIEAFRSGADGVFCRNSPFDLLWKSLDAIVQGEIWANSAELRYVLDEFRKAPKPLTIDPVVERRLTRREADVARGAVEGLSNREIARKLGLTEHTVKNYLFKIFDKLGVSNRVELVLSCLRQEQAAPQETVVHLALGVAQGPARRDRAVRQTQLRLQAAASAG
jgi:DNA-binding NarL/FixJ family response regulator